MGWDPTTLKVDIMLCTRQLIHLAFQPDNGHPLHYSFVYSFHDKHECRQFFQHLFQQLGFVPGNGPGLLLGDFDCVANPYKRLGQPVSLHKLLTLRQCMTQGNLHDMKSNGRFFTWNNKQVGNKRVFSKIDIALCNDK